MEIEYDSTIKRNIEKQPMVKLIKTCPSFPPFYHVLGVKIGVTFETEMFP